MDRFHDGANPRDPLIHPRQERYVLALARQKPLPIKAPNLSKTFNRNNKFSALRQKIGLQPKLGI
jgi:hypothetical protein